MKKENKNLSRRSFLKSSALAGTIGVISGGATGLLSSCSSDNKKSGNIPLREPGSYYIPDLPDLAADGRELKAGVIGCGGRGSGAAIDFLNSANNVTIVALGDVFEDKVNALADRLKKVKDIDIPNDKRFVGLDAYKKVVDSGVDVVIDCTPPFFRPLHFEYIVQNNKHSFLEKPLFVDAVGYRKVIATAKQAQAKNLSVVTGTIRHHQRSYVASHKQIMDGVIGEITGGGVYYNVGAQWHKERQPGWSDLEYMLRDWFSWRWLSGDHILEQHIHSIDAFFWLTGLKPVSALAFGSNHRRVVGDRFDNFSTDFVMENGVHMHSMCRQIDGCTNNISNYIQGTKGTWIGTGAVGGEVVIKDLTGKVIWEFDEEEEKANYKQTNPFVLEHVNLVNCIRSNTPIEQVTEMCVSNMAAMMGRESAYTGLETTWEAMTASSLDYTPADLSLTGKMDMSAFVTPIPGTGNNK
ncbi:MAG: Gfo/Idh/MocA family oxidoreductase [Dysgonamonadaceae bacterium]|nr:Gfo/Idh/MocA family oxidoreductase [Dysgonamonadaceae bacterium]MDD4728531.1 Gfo/Idh/MocA family oxidoreductase [Dysgonamonadaceae bacterium]